MPRLSPIVVGSVILAPLILGVEVYALYGSHRHPAPKIAAAAEALPATPPPSMAVPRPPPPTESPPPATGDSPAVTEDSPTITDATTDAGTEIELGRRQRLLATHRRQLIRDADEQTFQTLNLPEPTRAAIRAIDDDYSRATQALQDPGPNAPGDFRNPEVDLNAEQTRHAAIANLLGPEGARTFTAAERKAERTLRNRLRPQWVRGL